MNAWTRFPLIGTDGIWEARNPGDDTFGKPLRKALIRRWAHHDPRRVRDEILAALAQCLATSRRADDVTLIVARVE
jgi:sigma-B regulation protein RsbU (phosphoserine phosphatase)